MEARIDGMIDSHIHILPPKRTASLVRWIKRAFPEHPSPENLTPAGLLDDIRACGVVKAFNFVFPLEPGETEGLNVFSRDIAREFEMVVPFGSMHAETPDKEAVARRFLLDYGLAGIKLHPYVQGFEAFSPAFEPLFRTLDELCRPLVVHTGFDAFYGRSQDLDYLEVVLGRYPDMPVVLVHSLFPRFRLAYELMERHPLLYLDMTNVPGTIRLYREAPGILKSGPACDEAPLELGHFDALLRDFNERIMYGTDHPAGMGSPRTIYSDFEDLVLDGKVRENILRNTPGRFLSEYCGRWGGISEL